MNTIFAESVVEEEATLDLLWAPFGWEIKQGQKIVPNV